MQVAFGIGALGARVGLGALVGLGAVGCGSAAATDPIVGTTWQLLEIESMTSEQPGTRITDPTKYTVTFGDDGQAAFQIDCNRGSGTFQTAAAADDSGSLTFGPIALTRMFCPQPSDDTKVAAALGYVRSYLLSNGQLHLSLLADSGIMHWEPLPKGQ
jgi:heat shock protein HslJ